ncbi:MAG: polysaccharide biosynthesis protein, partial [Deltaproteobacteria bacterium]|nr:polysaccharide biosynthesis protein [Deltaproteobacteria bacterium]
ARNVIAAALDNGVHRVLALSTDKAVNPENLYGATKLVAEKLFIQANSYRGTGPTRLSCARYGNVVGSRGSVVPLFRQQRASGTITVTDKRMTRFWITLEQGVRFVIESIERMHGGELFIPKIPSASIMDVVEVIAPDCVVEVVGIRPGEKLHETLLSEDEARRTVELDDMYVVVPAHPWWNQDHLEGARLPEGFRYTSDSNPNRLQAAELAELINQT